MNIRLWYARKRTALFFLLPAAVLAGVVAWWAQTRVRADEPAAANTVEGIACLGRIEPLDGVLRVAAPYYSAGPAIVVELHVHEGDSVKRGEILAVLDSHQPMEAAREQAVSKVRVAETRLAQVKAGAKAGDIASQAAELQRAEAALVLAKNDYDRNRALYAAGVISKSQLDEQHATWQESVKAVQSARERLNSVSEVRDTDVRAAEADVASAKADLARADSELANTVVRAPFSGTVYKIYAYPGAETGTDGILDLGRTGQMRVIAEVYETDITRVRLGQRASISSPALSRPVEGTVERIESEVAKNSILPGDPTEFAEARIVRVHIRPDNNDALRSLARATVSVVIHP